MASTQLVRQVFHTTRSRLRKVQQRSCRLLGYHATGHTVSFLSLPAEIRELVYQHIFQDVRITPVEPGQGEGDHLSLLLLSEESYEEIENAMLRNATVIVRNPPDLIWLNRRKRVFEILRHVEVKSELLPGSISTEGCDSRGLRYKAGTDLAWQKCFLSALPNLKTVTIYARTVTSGLARIRLDDGSILSNWLHYLYRIVERTEHVACGETTAESGKKYFKGELWRLKAEEAGKTRIKWMLNVPFWMNFQQSTSIRVGVWPWRQQRFKFEESEGWVWGKMDFDEHVLRFEVGEWRYEYPQLQ